MTEPTERIPGRGKSEEVYPPGHEQMVGSRHAHGEALPQLDANEVRKVVAGNPNTPKQVLARLAGDSSTYIRKTVAMNPKTPSDVLQQLAKDEISEVRLAVAENPHITADVLAILVLDSDDDVRFGVAENPHIHEDVLFKLTSDENPFVRHRAMKTLEMLSPDVQTRLKIMLQQAFLFTQNNNSSDD